MIDGREKRDGWLNLELESPHVIERRSKQCFIVMDLRTMLFVNQIMKTLLFLICLTPSPRSRTLKTITHPGACWIGLVQKVAHGVCQELELNC